MGKLFVIDGFDGSGKRTQAEKLYEYLSNKGLKVRLVSFPVYDSDSSALVRMYLNGEISDDLYDINPYGASLFYACDRYVTWKKDLESFYKDGGIILCDRYISSNILHQSVKIENTFAKRVFADWLYDIETRKLGMPVPDKVFLLLVDPKISSDLMLRRYDGDANKKDLHEKNLQYLYACYENATEVATYCGWSIIDCMTEDKANILPVDEIFNKIVKELNLEE